MAIFAVPLPRKWLENVTLIRITFVCSRIEKFPHPHVEERRPLREATQH
jgi:hypothetical protein